MTKLEVAAMKFAEKNYSWLKNALPTIAAEKSFIKGVEWRNNNLWHDAQGDDLPEIDREVIVLTQPYHLEGSEYAISFAHRPCRKGYLGKSLVTGNIETYYPETYGKGGWSIPDVKYWLDVKFPNE